MISVVRENCSEESLTGVVCNNTNVSKAHKHEIIGKMEEQSFKPLQWLVCLLHCYELPFRIIIKNLNGQASGSREFRGQIGEQLSVDHKTLKTADYPPVKVQLISVAESKIKKLNIDQKHLLIASNAVILEKSNRIKTLFEKIIFRQITSYDVVDHYQSTALCLYAC